MKHKKLAGSIILVVLLLLGILLVSSFAVGWNNSSDLHAFLGERYLDALDYEQAIAAFEQAINIDPKNEDAYRMLAETYDKMVKAHISDIPGTVVSLAFKYGKADNYTGSKISK